MNKLFSFIDFLFRSEWKIQQYLMKISREKKYNLKRISNIFFILAVILFVFLKYELTRVWIFFLIFFLHLSFTFLSKSLFTFTTMRGFMSNGIKSALLVFFIMFVTFVTIIDKNLSYEAKNYVYYFLIIFLLSIVWFVFSTFCNVDVSILSNAILSLIIGVIIQFNSIFWSIFKMTGKHLFSEHILEIILQSGYHEAEYMKIAIDMIIFPVFIMSSFGVSGSALKKYWIKKYNKGNDIIEQDRDKNNSIFNNVE
ncbi:hypothetical protein EPT55_03335 [Fusobacterium necrophorum]|uniref:hypothetical protein n=1 Tax=Fusobacterium necrophorum TaxID=859 RepID=UPI0010118BE7|nr:hypothetical protein [Fusobacterium necrophorum]RXZ28627.1 hypothetical protein EPT55_03335 [Fusobacterium necrophorum]